MRGAQNEYTVYSTRGYYGADVNRQVSRAVQNYVFIGELWFSSEVQE